MGQGGTSSVGTGSVRSSGSSKRWTKLCLLNHSSGGRITDEGFILADAYPGSVAMTDPSNKGRPKVFGTRPYPSSPGGTGSEGEGKMQFAFILRVKLAAIIEQVQLFPNGSTSRLPMRRHGMGKEASLSNCHCTF